jgi:hypothetical protein
VTLDGAMPAAARADCKGQANHGDACAGQRSKWVVPGQTPDRRSLGHWPTQVPVVLVVVLTGPFRAARETRVRMAQRQQPLAPAHVQGIALVQAQHRLEEGGAVAGHGASAGAVPTPLVVPEPGV